MYRIKYIGILLLLPVLLNGQTFLSLDSAVREGLVKNYQILVSKNETENLRQNISYGNAGFLPTVTAFGSYDKSSLDSRVSVVSGAELDNPNAEATFTTAGIRADWVLFDGADMFVNYDKLKSAWKISDLQTKITMENVASDIILTYCNIIRQKKLLEASIQRLQTSRMRFEIAKEKLNSGLGSEQEWLQSQVALQADSTSLIIQSAELKKSKILLNRVLASDVAREYVTQDSIPLIHIPDLDPLKTNSLQSNNLLKIHTENLMYSKLEEKSLKSGHYPKLYLTGSYSYYETKTEASFIKYNKYFGPQVGLNIGFKLFDGMQLSNSIQTARVNVENQELLLQDMQQEVIALMSETWLDYQSQLQSVALGKERLILSQKNLDIAMKAYKMGMISSVDLRVAQDDLFRATSDLVNSYFNVKVKETELLSISGMLIN